MIILIILIGAMINLIASMTKNYTVVWQTAPFDNEQQSINTAYLHFVEGLPVLDAILL